MKLTENIKLKTVKSEWEGFFDTALEMLEIILKNNSCNKKTVMIVPVGPVGQYPVLAKLVNQLGISLKNVYFFYMDEYMQSPYKMIDKSNPLSFEKRMYDEFYSLVDEKLVMPVSQRLFPTLGNEKEFDSLLEALGGADLCVGGLGINGHIAFNEAVDEKSTVTADDYAKTKTRILPLTKETIAINASGYLRGDIAGMPKWCITIGMKQILSSRAVYITLNRPWQHGILKRVLFDEIKPQIPASLLRNHNNVTFCMTEDIKKDLL